METIHGGGPSWLQAADDPDPCAAPHPPALHMHSPYAITSKHNMRLITHTEAHHRSVITELSKHAVARLAKQVANQQGAPCPLPLAIHNYVYSTAL